MQTHFLSAAVRFPISLTAPHPPSTVAPVQPRMAQPLSQKPYLSRCRTNVSDPMPLPPAAKRFAPSPQRQQDPGSSAGCQSPQAVLGAPRPDPQRANANEMASLSELSLPKPPSEQTLSPSVHDQQVGFATQALTLQLPNLLFKTCERQDAAAYVQWYEDCLHHLTLHPDDFVAVVEHVVEQTCQQWLPNWSGQALREEPSVGLSRQLVGLLETPRKTSIASSARALAAADRLSGALRAAKLMSWAQQQSQAKKWLGWALGALRSQADNAASAVELAPLASLLHGSQCNFVRVATTAAGYLAAEVFTELKRLSCLEDGATTRDEGRDCLVAFLCGAPATHLQLRARQAAWLGEWTSAVLSAGRALTALEAAQFAAAAKFLSVRWFSADRKALRHRLDAAFGTWLPEFGRADLLQETIDVLVAARAVLNWLSPETVRCLLEHGHLALDIIRKQEDVRLVPRALSFGTPGESERQLALVGAAYVLLWQQVAPAMRPPGVQIT